MKKKWIWQFITSTLLLTAGSLTGFAIDESPVIYPSGPNQENLLDNSLQSNPKDWGCQFVRDPAIYKGGDTYYVFSTDTGFQANIHPGIQIRKSQDLVHWQMIGQAFTGIPKQAEKWSGAWGLWAPDIIKIINQYYLYYAASKAHQRKSFIGVARSRTLGESREKSSNPITTIWSMQSIRM